MGNRSRAALVALVALVAILLFVTKSSAALGQSAFLIAAMALTYIGPFVAGALAQIARGSRPLPSGIALLLGASVAVMISLIWTAPYAPTASPMTDTLISALAFGSASEIGALLVRTASVMRDRGRVASEEVPEARP